MSEKDSRSPSGNPGPGVHCARPARPSSGCAWLRAREPYSSLCMLARCCRLRDPSLPLYHTQSLSMALNSPEHSFIPTYLCLLSSPWLSSMKHIHTYTEYLAGSTCTYSVAILAASFSLFSSLVLYSLTYIFIHFYRKMYITIPLP